ncbi:MAG: hypothetical protein ACOY4O_19165 [Pseudomonadota bacterium]|jgi:hypothetical protein
MKTVVIATAVVMSFAVASFVATGAWAQGNAGSAPGGTSATGTGGPLPAPVGHRQPKRSDVPELSADQARNDAADRELDRKIRSICRGC